MAEECGQLFLDMNTCMLSNKDYYAPILALNVRTAQKYSIEVDFSRLRAFRSGTSCQLNGVEGWGNHRVVQLSRVMQEEALEEAEKEEKEGASGGEKEAAKEGA